MNRQMRTDLFSISKKCNCGNFCKVCNAMGYSLDTELSEFEIEKLIEGINFSPATAVVVPGASFSHPQFENYKLKIKKEICYAFTYSFWKTNVAALSKKIDPQKIAIVSDQPDEIDVSIIPFDSVLCLLLCAENLSTITRVSTALSAERSVRFCFPSNSLGNKSFLEPSFILKNFSNSLLKNLFLSHGTPFNHDIVDGRNKDHLQWVFLPNAIYTNRVPNSKIKISIIIPCYNRQKLLLKVITQIAASEMNPKNFEIILIDDGSEQKQSRGIVEGVKLYKELNIQVHYLARKRRITTLYTENRAGPARNLGAALANGEILLFLDSDILLPPPYLEKICKLHRLYHVVSPVRKYLSKACTENFEISFAKLSQDDLMTTPWDKYLGTLYEASDWQALPWPWMYFMTYALSITKEKFGQTGGFRTNYISYGYEDLDLGYRLFNDGKTEYYNYKFAVYHLYHFESGNEYTLENDFRYFQLAMSTRTFISQYFYKSAELIKLATLKNKKQKQYFTYFKWKRALINYASCIRRFN